MLESRTPDAKEPSSSLTQMRTGPATVTTDTRFQKTVALSGTEAEYMALSDCKKEVVWMRLLLKAIGSKQERGTVIYEDNQNAMVLAKNTGYPASTKHIGIRYHFIREKVLGGEVELEYADTKNQLADYLTNALSTKTLRYLIGHRNVRNKLQLGYCGCTSLYTSIDAYRRAHAKRVPNACSS
ncbi:hypothetical protein PC120_g20352 [Phytophthora cactorum]|nr:hypothetical protein PC120_g20352 [Phytophthora cactorum]